MTLYIKHRPTKLDKIYGNRDLVSSLTAILKNPPHAFLFHGPTGCGKTTIARIIANELGCKGSDLREVDSADFRGIETVRDIRKQSMYRSLESSCRVWILDECHKMSNDAQNALLKALEDTPKHVYYILCTTEPEKLIKTIKGRCSQFQVNLLNDVEMKKLLRSIYTAEGQKLEKEVYEQIIETAVGHPRNAIQILEQVLAVKPEERLEIAKRSAEMQTQSIELCRALIKGASWQKVRNILTGLKKEDPETIRRQVLGYCSSVLLNNDDQIAGKIMEEMIEPFYNSGFPGLVFACYSIIKGE